MESTRMACKRGGGRIFQVSYRILHVLCLILCCICTLNGQESLVAISPQVTISSQEDESSQRLKCFEIAFQNDEVGPIRFDNLSKGYFIDVIRREVNKILERKSGFTVSGGYGASQPCPQVFNVPRTLYVPRMTISNIFVFVATKLNCSLENMNGYICMEQKITPCTSIQCPKMRPTTLFKCRRIEYPGKRRIMGKKELSVINADKFSSMMTNTYDVMMTAVCCEYFLGFPDNQIVGVLTDEEEQKVVGFDFGWSNKSVLDVDEGLLHKIKLIKEDCEDSEDAIPSNANMMKANELYRIIMGYWETTPCPVL